MASSTLLYIAWPVTLGLSFMAGGMIFSNEPTPGKTKNGNQSSKISRRNSSSNDSTSAVPNRRLLATRSPATKDGYAESYDIKEITNTSDPQKRLTKLLSMLDQLGPGDFEQVVTDFRELGLTEERIAEYELLLNTWAKINPEGALAYTRENTNTTFATTSVLEAWAGYAPDAAIRWVMLNHKGDIASPYLVDVIKGMASTNLERATDLLPKLNYNERDKAVCAIIPHVSKLGREKAIAWLATIKDEKLRTSATREIASSLATKDPQATIDWLQTFSADAQKKYYSGPITSALALLDIDKAAEWTSSLEGYARMSNAQKIIGKLASSDPKKAVTWMKTMSGESGYKYVVRNFFSATKRDHPEVALANLALISNDRVRKECKAQILLSWTAKDKAAATQWMQSNNTDAAAQEKFLSAPKGYHKRQSRVPLTENNEYLIRR